MIPLCKVFMAPEAEELVRHTLYSGWIGEGPRTEEFERELGRVLAVPLPLAVNSGTSALWLALDLAGVVAGDSIISTPMTCAATNIAIKQRGAQIIWADVQPKTGNICPESVKRLLSQYKPKAIMTVDFGGVPVECEEIRALANRYGCKWIDDAAHAPLATYQGRPIGKWADFTCFSFQAIKHLTTADGGALICLDPEKREEGRLKRWFGLDRHRGGFRSGDLISLLGYKFHMTDIAASIGLANLEYLAENVEKARENAEYYNQALFSIPKCEPPKHSRPAWWLYTIFVDNPDEFSQELAKRGIQALRTHRRNDRHPIFAGSVKDGALAGLEEFDSHQIQIPVGWWVEQKDREYIAEEVNRLCSDTIF